MERMDVDKPQPLNTTQHTPKQRVSAFLGQMARETSVSKGKARLQLARKLNERTRHLQNRRKQRERIKKLTKDLQTTEATIQLIEEDIKKLESAVEEGTDGEDE